MRLHTPSMHVPPQVWPPMSSEQRRFVVLRVHACVSVLPVVAQAPAAQWYAMTPRVCVPPSSQVLVKPPHALHAP